MDKLVDTLSKTRLFKSISIRQKTLAFLVVLYLWIPMRNKILFEQFRRWSYRNLRLNSIARIQPQPTMEEHNEVCIPKLPKLIVIYYYVSTFANLTNCLTASMIKFRTLAEDRVADDLFTCYMPRMHLHEYVSQNYAVWYSLLYSLTLLAVKGYIFVRWNDVRLDAIAFLLLDTNRQLNPNQHNAKINPFDRSSVSNLLFCCIDSGYKNRAELKLRPNRTRAAKEQLEKIVESGFVSAVISCLATACILVPINFIEVLTKHESIYQGCRISYGDFVYWYRTITSIVMFNILFIDVYLMLPLGASFAHILIADLLIYWNHIEERLSRIKGLLERRHRLIGYQTASSVVDAAKLAEAKLGSVASSWFATRQIDTLERDLIELRTLMDDFFGEVRQVDKVISWGTFVLFCNWLLSNAVATFTGLQLDRSTSHATIVRCFHLIGIIEVSVISHLVLNLKRHTRPSYGTICSLMALDQSSRKRDWMRLVDFYTNERLCYAFTFFGSGVFDELMFLKLVSYTFTLFSYVETFQLK